MVTGLPASRVEDGLLKGSGETASTYLEGTYARGAEDGAGFVADGVPDGLCEDCEDRRSMWACSSCEGDFCDVCFHALHRKGKRALHKPVRIEGRKKISAEGGDASEANSVKIYRGIMESIVGPRLHLKEVNTDIYDRDSLANRAKYVPVRLSMEERVYLRLVEAVVSVSDYTSSIDKPFSTPVKRQHTMLQQITSILGGLVTAMDLEKGKEMMYQREYSEYEEYFQDVLEIARRHKIMNPEKMRTEYAKMIYMMQDAVSPPIQKMLEFNMKRGIKSVYALLEEKGGVRLLSDPLVEIATKEVLPDKNKSRGQIQQEIKHKVRVQRVEIWGKDPEKNPKRHFLVKWETKAVLCEVNSEEELQHWAQAVDAHADLRPQRTAADRERANIELKAREAWAAREEGIWGGL